MAFFHYDNATDREWVEIELRNGSWLSRATVQDYARVMDMEPKRWVEEGLHHWITECDRRGAHGHQESIPAPPPLLPAWRMKLADRLYRLADRLSEVSDT